MSYSAIWNLSHHKTHLSSCSEFVTSCFEGKTTYSNFPPYSLLDQLMNTSHGPNREILPLNHNTQLSFSLKVWNKTVITVVLSFETVWQVYVILWLFRAYRIIYISFVEVNNPSGQKWIPVSCYYSQTSLCQNTTTLIFLNVFRNYLRASFRTA